jgi:hypothetical protein
MNTTDSHAALHSRVFKSLMLSEDIATREEQGQLLKAESQIPQTSLFGEYEAYFTSNLRERALRMTYAYSLFFCFENMVRELVAQRLAERKGANWWSARLEMCQWKRETLDKESIWDEARSTSLSRW